LQLNGPGCHRCCAKRTRIFTLSKQTVKKEEEKIGLFEKKVLLEKKNKYIDLTLKG